MCSPKTFSSLPSSLPPQLYFVFVTSLKKIKRERKGGSGREGRGGERRGRRGEKRKKKIRDG